MCVRAVEARAVRQGRVSATTNVRAKQLFLDALARPERERATFIADACGGDQALRKEVESLLGWHGAGTPPTSQASFPSRHLQRRRATPDPTAASLSGQQLPSDVLLQTSRRVVIVSFAFAAVWALMTVVNNVVLPIIGDPARAFYPYPGTLVGVLAVVSSLLMAYAARRLGHRPELVVDAGSAFLLLQCLFISILSQWFPPMVVPRISWACIPILFYPAVVPNSPGKTLWVSLLAASTEPLALGLMTLRGIEIPGGFLYLVWSFLPNYICAFLVVIPVKIIHRLGRQVSQARELGSYRLQEPLGKGGMGEVFRATHQMLARPAAVKLIRSEVLGARSPAEARVITERFRREAEATASLRSPHTIDLYDFGVAQDGTFFFVMELLDGLDMATLVEHFGPLSPERAVHLLRQACDSLEEAHARGLIHRDIKPSNIFTCRMGLEVDFVKVLDFGLVKAVGQEGREATMLTAPDATWGTPGYIAPEVARGEKGVDHRVDIYALGCVAYWLITGQQVFEGANVIKLLFQHIDATPVPPSQRTELIVPPALDEAILACLAKDPKDRPATAGDLSRRLGAAVVGDGWTPERAHEWWDRHHPETVGTETIQPGPPILVRGW